MARSRDSRIKAAPRLAQAFTALQAYESTVRPIRVGTQGPREPRKSVYVTPFGFDILATQRARTTAAIDQYTLMAPIVNGAGTGAEVADVLGSNEIAPVRGFRPAKVKWFRNATVVGVPQTSDRTGLPYLKYNGENYTCPFGRKTESDNMYDVFNAMKAEILQISGFQMSRVSLMRENFSLQN